MMTHDVGSVVKRLDARWRALVNSPYRRSRSSLCSYLRFVQSRTEFSAAVAALGPHLGMMASHINGVRDNRGQWRPEHLGTDVEEAALGWEFLNRFSLPDSDIEGTAAEWAKNQEVDAATTQGVSLAISIFVEPLHRYLIEHVESGALVLHHFDRFATWSRHFGHDVLHDVVKDEAQSDSVKKQWEGRLKEMAAEWVFRDGLPVSDVLRETKSASGGMDFVVKMPGDRLVIIEAKLLGTFSSKPNRPADLAKGVRQLRTYVNDHPGAEGYLLVFHDHDGEVVPATGANVRRVQGTSSSFEITLDDRRIGLILVRLKKPPEPSAGVPSVPLGASDLIA